MTQKELTDKIAEHIKKNDKFATWLGVELLENAPGYAKIKMKIRPDMINSFGTCHGGVTLAFAQTALAFCSNNYGNIAVALDTGMAFTTPLYEGDEVIAETKEESKRSKIAVYTIRVTKTTGETVGIFRGSVYDTGKKYFPEIEVDDA